MVLIQESGRIDHQKESIAYQSSLLSWIQTAPFLASNFRPPLVDPMQIPFWSPPKFQARVKKKKREKSNNLLLR